MKLIDLIGKKFKRLTVIKRIYPNNKWEQVKWLCKCDCGNETIVHGYQLVTGNTKSCGCLQREHMRDLGLHRKIGLGLANMHNIIAQYKARAKRKGYEYKLTEKQFKKITQKDCHYCGAKPNNIANIKDYNGKYIYNGLDRINNTKGYIIDNVVPCCKMCNDKKSNMTLQEFKDWIKKVYNKMYSKYNRRTK